MPSPARPPRSTSATPRKATSSKTTVSGGRSEWWFSAETRRSQRRVGTADYADYADEEDVSLNLRNLPNLRFNVFVFSSLSPPRLGGEPFLPAEMVRVPSRA